MNKMLFAMTLTASVVSATQAEVIPHQVSETVSFQAVTWQGDTVVASGTAGGIFLSSDNGASWREIESPAGSESRQFRDNQRLENGRLVVMSAGEGPDSGVFISDNDGDAWQRVSTGQAASTFYDCFEMTDNEHGWLYGDSDERGLFLLSTKDGGTSWQRQDIEVAAQPSEGGFASSGTCLNGMKGSNIMVGTGNAGHARLLLNIDDEWHAIVSPLAGGEASGIFSVQMADKTIYAAGGSLARPESAAVAWTYHTSQDKWEPLPTVPFNGALYGSALLLTPSGVEYWVSNPEGVAVLKPQATTWQVVSNSNIWSLACQAGKGCIGVGKDGVIELFR